VFLKYHPAGQDEPQVWEFKLGAMRSVDIEAIERRTPWEFGGEFKQRLLKGSALARRALLWVLLRRTDAFLKFDDIEFADDEVTLEMDGGEIVEYIDGFKKAIERGLGDPDELEQAIGMLEAQLVEWQEAHPEQDAETAGKAPTPSA
jgi:hypothetical protein